MSYVTTPFGLFNKHGFKKFERRPIELHAPVERGSLYMGVFNNEIAEGVLCRGVLNWDGGTFASLSVHFPEPIERLIVPNVSSDKGLRVVETEKFNKLRACSGFNSFVQLSYIDENGPSKVESSFNDDPTLTAITLNGVWLAVIDNMTNGKHPKPATL